MAKERKSQRGRSVQGQEKNQGPRTGGSGSPRSDRADGLAVPQGVRNWVDQAVTFLREVRVEFGKVTWSSRKEAIATTGAVLAITLFFTAYLGLVDITLSKLIAFLIY